jgi:hypothetical protein
MITDIIYIMAAIVFFGVCFLFAAACDTFFHSRERGREEDQLPKQISGEVLK